MTDRLAVRKTYKLYLGGAFPRSESGRTYEVTDSKGHFLANAARASRKDARDAVVAAQPHATANHRWDRRDVFGPVIGHRPVYLAAREGGRVVGVLPQVAFRSRLFGTFFCSLPFVNYGGVLTSAPDAAPPLLAEAARLAREAGASHVELRHVARQFDDAPVRQHKVTMLLSLKETADQAAAIAAATEELSSSANEMAASIEQVNVSTAEFNAALT
jgi:hypothetical protein